MRRWPMGICVLFALFLACSTTDVPTSTATTVDEARPEHARSDGVGVAFAAFPGADEPGGEPEDAEKSRAEDAESGDALQKPAGSGTTTSQPAGGEPRGGTAPDEEDATPPADEPSEAEKIARTKRSIETGQTELAKLRAALEDPASEYEKAETAFNAIDGEVTTKQKELESLKREGKTEEAAALAASLGGLENKRELAEDRFNLALEERKALKAKIANLEQAIKQNEEALKRLLGEDEAATAPPTSEGAGTPQPAPEKTTEPPGGAPASPEPASAPAPGGEMLPGAGAAAPGGTPSDEPGSDAAPEGKKEPTNEQVVAAEKEAEAKQEIAEKAEKEVRSLAERLATLEEDIETEQKLLETARQRSDLEVETQRSLENELREQQASGAAAAEIEEVRGAIRESKERFQEAQTRVREHTDRLGDLQTKRAELQAEQISALQDAEAKKKEFEAAQEEVESLKNPFSPRNILQWTLDHGPRILLILAGMFLALYVVKLLSGRLVALIVRSGTRRGSLEERENRAQTLVSVFQNTVRVLIITGGIAMVLQAAGINIGLLLGGAAVFGLAVAFGAQKLIRDYFHGFVILLENQYHINDVVKIAGIAGLVERITLRMTVLRDLEGTVHFVPNGEINTVSNLTHGWSRAVFDVGVAYKEDADRVMEIIRELGSELRTDSTFGPLILDDLQMLGVDALADSAIVIKFFIKTRPLKQWDVKRELLRRIKRKFDELGIEIPFPHRTVYYRERPPPRDS